MNSRLKRGLAIASLCLLGIFAVACAAAYGAQGYNAITEYAYRFLPVTTSTKPDNCGSGKICEFGNSASNNEPVWWNGSIYVYPPAVSPSPNPSTDNSKCVVYNSSSGFYNLSTCGAAGSVAIGNAVGSGAAESVLFVDGSHSLAQDTNLFVYDASTHTLTPGYHLLVADSSPASGTPLLQIMDHAGSGSYLEVDGSPSQIISAFPFASGHAAAGSGNFFRGYNNTTAATGGTPAQDAPEIYQRGRAYNGTSSKAVTALYRTTSNTTGSTSYTADWELDLGRDTAYTAALQAKWDGTTVTTTLPGNTALSGGEVHHYRLVLDADTTVTTADYIVYYATITATRTATLPTSPPNGTMMVVGDLTGALTPSTTITVKAAGTIDGIAGATGVKIVVPNCTALYQSDGTNWFTITGKHCYLPTWTAPTLLNSYVNFGSPFDDAGYYKDSSGWVHLRGVVKSGTAAAAIFNLPAGFRPSATKKVPGLVDNGTTFIIDIDGPAGTIGNVHADSGGTTDVFLDGISFPAAN